MSQAIRNVGFRVANGARRAAGAVRNFFSRGRGNTSRLGASSGGS